MIGQTQDEPATNNSFMSVFPSQVQNQSGRSGGSVQEEAGKDPLGEGLRASRD